MAGLLVRSRGFTLLEVVIVVAIIGVVIALAGSVTQRHTSRSRVRDASRHFRARVEHARTLAVAAGPRLGTPMFRNCFGQPAPAPGGLNLAINIDPATGTYTVPTNLVLAPGGAFLDSTCQTFNINAVNESNQNARLTVNGGAAGVTFGFTPNGRLNSPPFFVRFEDSLDANEATRGHGFRILQSGIICTAGGVTSTECLEGQ